MAIRSSSGFSHLRPGVFHISLGTHKTQHTQPRAQGKENKQTRTWVISKRKQGEIFDTFVQLSVHMCAITSVHLREIPTKPPETLTHHLTLANRASATQVLALAFLDLRLSPISVDCPGLSTGIFCSGLGLCLPSSSSCLVGDLVRKPFLWISNQNRKKGSSDWHTHPHNKCPTSCHKALRTN